MMKRLFFAALLSAVSVQAAGSGDPYPSALGRLMVAGDIKKAISLMDSSLDSWLGQMPLPLQRINLLFLAAELMQEDSRKARDYYVLADQIYDELIAGAGKQWDEGSLKYWKSLRKADFNGPASAEILREWPKKSAFLSYLRARQAVLDLYILGGEFGDEKYREKGEKILSADYKPDAYGDIFAQWPGYRWTAAKDAVSKDGVEISIAPQRHMYFNRRAGLPVPLGLFRRLVPVSARVKNGGSGPLTLGKGDVVWETSDGPSSPLTPDRIENIIYSKSSYGRMMAAWFALVYPHAAPYQTGGLFERDAADEFAAYDKENDARGEAQAWSEWSENFDRTMKRFWRNYSRMRADTDARYERNRQQSVADMQKMQDRFRADRTALRGDTAGAALERREADVRYNDSMRASRSYFQKAQAEADAQYERDAAETEAAAAKTEGTPEAKGEAVSSTALRALRTEMLQAERAARRFWEESLPLCRVWPGQLTLKPGETWEGFLFFDLGSDPDYTQKARMAFKINSGEAAISLKAEKAADFGPPSVVRVQMGNDRRAFMEAFSDILQPK